MFLRKKGQSTAEYALVIGLVIAVVAGVLQVALKGGIRQKNKQAMDYLLGAGNNDLSTLTPQSEAIYTQDYRDTTIKADTFKDRAIMRKGGAEEKEQVQETTTDAVTLETIDAVGTN
jgi:hypothetical protein